MFSIEGDFGHLNLPEGSACVRCISSWCFMSCTSCKLVCELTKKAQEVESSIDREVDLLLNGYSE